MGHGNGHDDADFVVAAGRGGVDRLAVYRHGGRETGDGLAKDGIHGGLDVVGGLAAEDAEAAARAGGVCQQVRGHEAARDFDDGENEQKEHRHNDRELHDICAVERVSPAVGGLKDVYTLCTVSSNVD